ncbi:ABC transporter permease [Leucobacter soli]|uniref:Aliphatic sulfonates transport permease protein SsuC n=1 Tax=Leucobacter soli TaxID=2812850 RepID=A0A916K249_9MICO|nr:ABC transporter permease [Leucobacter soli]CAG7616474.1 Putative aliphatic sulfonates transport permease protein SsuC [Leucobacter soli]
MAIPTQENEDQELRRSAVAPPGGARLARSARWVIGAILPVAVIVVWQIAANIGLINTQLFPAPSQVFARLVDLAANGVLGKNFLISLQRAVIGTLWGAGLGLAVGLLVGFSSLAERALDPTVQMLRTVPLIAVTPLFILWFGFGEESKIVLIAVGAFFPIYVNSFLGVRAVDRKLFEMSATLGFTAWQRLRLVVLPGAMPNILLGLRLSIGMAWLCLVVAELMGATSGIGYLIQDARSLLDTATVMVGVIIFAAIGKLSDSLVRLLERRTLRWRDTFAG